MSRVVAFKDGMKLGLGYDRLSGDVLPSPAVQGSGISAVQGAAGQQVSIDCVTIQDVETLHRSLGISVDAGGSYMGFSGSAKVDYVHSCDFSSFSTYVMVRVSVQDAFESLDGPVFGADATDLIVTNNKTRFRDRFGDAFITGVKKGGEYFAIYQMTGTDQSERESVAVKVHAAFNSGLTSAELNTSINTATARSESHLEVRVHVFRQGSIGTADLNLEDIMHTAKTFPVDVSGDKAFPYEVLLEDYSTLKSPNDQFDYIQIQAQQDVLEDLAKKRFEFLTLRDDFQYILKHIGDFQNADGSPANRDQLSKEFEEVVNEINSMEKQASACVRDASKCAFTIFDTSKFALPTLTQKATDPQIARGTILADQDPLAAALRDAQPDGPARRGFLIGMAVAEGQTLPGPAKQAIHDTLPAGEQGGFSAAVTFSLERNLNAPLGANGAAIADKVPALAAARKAEPLGFYTLGFDIATGLFGNAALGGLGHTAAGPGAFRIRDGLEAAGQRGFNASMTFNLKGK
ncbi:MAG TPA: hypothetical protein VKG25_20375 [Bryobacteraceae bacterium]|nr:hypothetical protein [Bryobacteraceae bacterium]